MIGNPSQANYAAGGSYQDVIARHRASQGRIVVTIDLGIVQSVGFVAESSLNIEEWPPKSGLIPIAEADFLALVEHDIRKPRRSVQTSQVISGLRGI
ncbi:hypothetical protein F4777DRAFT_555610 [Nemania sp. FL0916]|nr:hypothetical protein F4777DRAFT_555610 [Nemania sp. FL0916]